MSLPAGIITQAREGKPIQKKTTFDGSRSAKKKARVTLSLRARKPQLAPELGWVCQNRQLNSVNAKCGRLVIMVVGWANGQWLIALMGWDEG